MRKALWKKAWAPHRSIALIGLSGSGKSTIAREIADLAGLTVIDIDKGKLPDPKKVKDWTGREFVDALTHDQSCARYNTSFRQLVHIGCKVAGEMGERYANALVASHEVINAGVTKNIYERHLRPIFFGQD